MTFVFCIPISQLSRAKIHYAIIHELPMVTLKNRERNRGILWGRQGSWGGGPHFPSSYLANGLLFSFLSMSYHADLIYFT